MVAVQDTARASGAGSTAGRRATTRRRRSSRSRPGTYDRVEGLPVMAGIALRRNLSAGQLSFTALGIYRSVNSFEWTSDNLGYDVSGGAAAREGARRHVRAALLRRRRAGGGLAALEHRDLALQLRGAAGRARLLQRAGRERVGDRAAAARRALTLRVHAEHVGGPHGAEPDLALPHEQPLAREPGARRGAPAAGERRARVRHAERCDGPVDGLADERGRGDRLGVVAGAGPTSDDRAAGEPVAGSR